MPRGRRRSRGRVPNRNANSPYVAPLPDRFTEDWYRRLLDRAYLRYVDLTRYEDRRRFDPERFETEFPVGPAPRGLVTRPRILIVPEGHRLARFQTYKGRKSLRQVTHPSRIETDIWHDWVTASRMRESRARPFAPETYFAQVREPISRRVGFSHPWQVIVCVRRQRRREVLHALRKTGRGGGAQKPPRRNFWSEVRC